MYAIKMHDDHVLPTVRLHKIVLNGFKSVKHGEIVFACAKKYVLQDTKSDILGIYGQNGSGKTAVIEALSILKRALMGLSIPSTYAECISKDAECAHLEFTFDFQYPMPAGYTRTITYSFDIKKVDAKVELRNENATERNLLKYPYEVRICDEVITASGYYEGVKDSAKHTIINSIGGKQYPMGPVTNLEPLLGKNKDELIVDIQVFKRLSFEKSQSFIFFNDTLKLLEENSNYSEAFQILFELAEYGMGYLHIVDTRAVGGRDKRRFTLNTRLAKYDMSIFGTNTVPKGLMTQIESVFNSINSVLKQIVPDLQVYPQIIGNEKKEDSEELYVFVLISHRGDVEIPLRDESEGIIKLVSVLALITAAFNDKSCTVAIDELDSGIFEYLLGELLIAFEEYGKGQLIFTSHNLRPLEVLKKEEIIFTTSNPDNRYFRLKGIGRTNNLRDVYLREIMDEDQDEQLYYASKRYKLVAAFKKAGLGYEEIGQ